MALQPQPQHGYTSLFGEDWRSATERPWVDAVAFDRAIRSLSHLRYTLQQDRDAGLHILNALPESFLAGNRFPEDVRWVMIDDVLEDYFSRIRTTLTHRVPAAQHGVHTELERTEDTRAIYAVYQTLRAARNYARTNIHDRASFEASYNLTFR